MPHVILFEKAAVAAVLLTFAVTFSAPQACAQGTSDVGIGIDQKLKNIKPLVMRQRPPRASSGRPKPKPQTQPRRVSDVRLKRDIVLLERLSNGIGLYRYRYVWSDTIYVGVIAQEVATIVPDAVSLAADGYLRVDYSRIGLQLHTWGK